MNIQDEILARVKRIETALGIPRDLPTEQICDAPIGCSNVASIITTVGYPKAVTHHRCQLHPPGYEQYADQVTQ